MNISTEEQSIFEDLSFPADVIVLIKENVSEKLEMLKLDVFDRERNLAQSFEKGISFLVPESESKKLIYYLREKLNSKGYLAFISKIHYAFEHMEDYDESDIPGTKHSIGIIKCENTYELIRLIGTDASNYDLGTEDIINKLKSWEKISDFEIMGVAYDWLEIDFTKLPENIESFAQEIYEFCPDTIEQGYIGPDPDENSGWEDFEEAFDNQTINDLANYLKKHKSILLWWD